MDKIGKSVKRTGFRSQEKSRTIYETNYAFSTGVGKYIAYSIIIKEVLDKQYFHIIFSEFSGSKIQETCLNRLSGFQIDSFKDNLEYHLGTIKSTLGKMN